MKLLAPAVATVLAAGCGGGSADSGGSTHREPFPRGAAAQVEDPRTSVPLGAAVTWAVLREDRELQAVVARAFDSVTPENELKFERVQPERGRFAFEEADALVDWARGQELRVRGHVLVWHQQLPRWLSAEDWGAAELERALTMHVRTVVGRYRGRIDTWDVVNEPLTDQGGWRTAGGSPWLGVLGPRYVEIALRAARAADPRARLFVNEIGAESGGPKLEALLRMARDLRSRGVPLDGIGLEAHLTASAPPEPATLRKTIDRLARVGLEVELTELDVADPTGDPRRQAAVFATAAAACAAARACRRVTTWGVSDRDSWLGPDRRALPFDASLRPKPAWEALTRALRR